MDGEKVSSSHIKTLLGLGRIEAANKRLAHGFFLLGEVYEDRKIGRTMGFPTANIRYPKGKYPLKKGVYETRVTVDGKTYKGITNYGARPTFDDSTVVTETHLDGFCGELYGKKLKIEFLRYIRDIQKFENVEKLKEQLQKDVRQVRDQ
jgi:riboflavin kinase/FMN adenylyltransferase